MPVLLAQNLSCEKQDRVLFHDLELEIKAGELVYLKGENGAGKTSLIRILVGLSAPTAGSVHLNGFDVRTDSDQASKQLMYIGHKLGNNSLLNATENIAFWCALHNVDVTKKEILSVLDFLGLTGLEELPIKHLSAGQQRRVSLARLWLNKSAKIWVLDEPFTALDVQIVQELAKKIDDFLERGGAVLMTSHQNTHIQHTSRVFELEYAW